MAYFPALDGLRAVAILFVLAVHGSYGHVPGGVIGVDIFFVLSGFLITRVLLQPAATLKNFYIRRALRLLPALACGLALAFALWHRTNPDISFWRAALPAAFYFADFQAMVNPGSLGTLSPTWSLAIEEQFYFVWPLVILFFATKPRRMTSSSIFLFAIGFTLLRPLLYFAWRSSVGYYSPLTRIDVLLVGCGLALSVDPPRWRIGAWVFAASLPFLALRLRQDSPIYLIVAIPFISWGTASVIAECLTAQSSLMKRILSLRPLVWIGQRSYGIYLYHLPIFAALEPLRRRNDVKNLVLVTGLRIALAMVFAALSYQFLERPILAKRTAPRRLA